MDEVTVDLKKKTAEVRMKRGSELKQDAVAAALKRNGGYGISAFAQKRLPVKKALPQTLIVGLSGMT